MGIEAVLRSHRKEINRLTIEVEQLKAELAAETLRADTNLMLRAKVETRAESVEAELSKAKPVLDAADAVFERHALGYAHIPPCCHNNPSECDLCLAVRKWRK